MASKGSKKGKGARGTVQIKTQGIRISLAGPPGKESQARGLLEFKLWTELRTACPFYFTQSGMTARFSQNIARKVPYQAWKDPKRKNIVANIRTLDLFYRNPPGGWRWWVKIRNDVNEMIAGTSATWEIFR